MSLAQTQATKNLAIEAMHKGKGRVGAPSPPFGAVAGYTGRKSLFRSYVAGEIFNRLEFGHSVNNEL